MADGVGKIAVAEGVGGSKPKTKENVDEIEIGEGVCGSKQETKVKVDEIEMAEGVGGSKPKTKENVDEIEIGEGICGSKQETKETVEKIPNLDAIADLRNLCLKENHPFPTFEFVQRAGPPECPNFTFKCSVATIMRYATASTKKAARQMSALEMLKAIRKISASSSSMETASVDGKAAELEELNKKKIRTYRDYIESDIKTPPGTSIFDRHNFFKNMEKEKKLKVYQIFYDENIISSKDKVDLALKVLEIPYKVEEIPAAKLGSMILIQLECELDVVLAGEKDSVYDDVIDYLKDMLV